MHDRIILFTRYPEPGRTKTRLIPILGPQGAAAFQKRLTEQAFAAAGEACARTGAALEVRFEGGAEEDLRGWLGPGADYRPQGEGDIGRRMERSLLAAGIQGAGRVVLVGSDIPGLRAGHLVAAFERLRACELVFGPAADGGYYLVGATDRALGRATRYLGPGIAWGTGDVLAATLARVRADGFACELLDALADVDRPDDLAEALDALGAGAECELSVIVPALNEEACLPQALRSCRAAGVEAIVIDGGSCDRTAGIALSCGARLLCAQPPRSIQMNAGAALARGAALLFLHADTRLPPDFTAQVRRALGGPGVAAGAFRLRIDAPGFGLRVIERAADRRSAWLQMPYGDQALFVTRRRFWAAGGFPALPLMEDFELVRRLRRSGRIALAPGRVLTSARRWRERGVLTTWLINQWVIGAYCLGVHPSRLARWYRGRPPRPDCPSN